MSFSLLVIHISVIYLQEKIEQKDLLIWMDFSQQDFSWVSSKIQHQYVTVNMLCFQEWLFLVSLRKILDFMEILSLACSLLSSPCSMPSSSSRSVKCARVSKTVSNAQDSRTMRPPEVQKQIEMMMKQSEEAQAQTQEKGEYYVFYCYYNTETAA